jgi:hypothetical protein
MRYCPFCSAENDDEAGHCTSCARRLPPLASRRGPSASVPAVTPAGTSGQAAPAPVASGSASGPVPVANTSVPASGPVPVANTRGPASGPVPVANTSVPASGPVPVANASVPASGPVPVANARGPASGPVPVANARGPASGPVPVASASVPASGPVPRAEATPTPRPVAAPPRTGQQTLQPPGLSRAVTPTPTPGPALVPASTVAVYASEDRPFKPASLAAVPEPPPAGMLVAIRYALSVSMARWQRRGAIKTLMAEIASEQARLDELLAMLGRRTRELGIDNRAFAAETVALDEAEKRRADIEQARSGLRDRQSGEQQSFTGLESERQSQVEAAGAALERARHEHASLEVQRKSLRDKRKAIERQQRELVRSAEQREEQAAKAVGEDAQNGLRRTAEEFRAEAAALEPERQELDHRLADLERPLAQAAAKIESLEAEVAAARRSLSDTRDIHRQHQAGLESDLERKSRELVQVEAEIQRRLLSLGTLVNLNRIPRPELDDLYARIDQLRHAIGLRSAEIDRLSAERDAHDRAALMRGFAGIGIGATALVLVLVVLVALL